MEKTKSRTDNLKDLRTGKGKSIVRLKDRKVALDAKRADIKATRKAAKKAAKEAAKKNKLKEKLAAKRAERKAKELAAKEANKKLKTGVLTVGQVKSITDGVPALVEVEPSESEKDKMAAEGDKEIRQLEGRFIQAAIIMRGFIVWQLWRRVVNPKTKEKDFKSLEKWAESAMPLSRAERFKAIAVAENVIPHIPLEEIKEMSSRNVRLLIDVPRAKLANPKIRAAAKKSERELRKAINQEAPEAHVDQQQEFVRVPAAAKESYEEAIEAITQLHELDSRAEATEALAVYFMQGQTEHPAYQGMNNRDAYDQLIFDRKVDGTEDEDEEVDGVDESSVAEEVPGYTVEEQEDEDETETEEVSEVQPAGSAQGKTGIREIAT